MAGGSFFKGSQALHRLLADFLTEKIDVSHFCEHFETTYNFEIDRSALRQAEIEAFDVLLNEVAHYSPFIEDRAKYSGYRNEKQIRHAALQTRSALDSS